MTADQCRQPPVHDRGRPSGGLHFREHRDLRSALGGCGRPATRPLRVLWARESASGRFALAGAGGNRSAGSRPRKLAHGRSNIAGQIVFRVRPHLRPAAQGHLAAVRSGAGSHADGQRLRRQLTAGAFHWTPPRVCHSHGHRVQPPAADPPGFHGKPGAVFVRRNSRYTACPLVQHRARALCRFVHEQRRPGRSRLGISAPSLRW